MNTATNQLAGPIQPVAANLQMKEVALATTANQIRAVLSRALYPIFALCLLMLTASVSRAETYQIISTENSVVGGDLNKTVTTVQVGDNPINRFSYTKVVKQASSNGLKDVFFLLPPLGSGFQNYEVGENGDYNNSFAAFFARRNYILYGISQRAQGLAAGTCESGAADCSAMADWGMLTFLQDIAFVRQQIELEHPSRKKIVGGLSLGSILAIAAISASPNDYDGAILIDGTIYDEDSAVRALNANFCAAADNLLANGVYYDGQGGPGFKLVSQLAQIDPNGLTPLPGFPPGFTNHQVFVLVLSVPNPSPLSPRPDFYQLAGSVAEDRFFFANESLVHASVAQFLDYVAIRLLRDLNCSLAGDTSFTGNLQSFTGPVMMFSAGHGFGTGMFDTAQLMTSANVTIKFNEVYGHVDLMFSTNHQQELEHPILNWLQKNF